MRVSRTTHADALHAAGEWEKAAKLFADAERRQRKRSRDTRCCTRCEGTSTATCCCRRDGPRQARDPGGTNHRNCTAEQLGSRHRARYSDPRPRPSRPGAANLGKCRRSVEFQPFLGLLKLRASLRRRWPTRGPRLTGSMRRSKACAPRGEMTISLAASSPAPRFAAPSATGTARNATLMKQKRSRNRD